MSGSNMEKFIIDLGFSDSEAMKGLKSFLKKMDTMSAKINKNLSGEAELKNKQRMIDAMHKEMHRDIKREAAAREALENKLFSLKKAHQNRLTNLEFKNKNFGLLKADDPKRARELLTQYRNLSKKLSKLELSPKTNLEGITKVKRAMAQLSTVIDSTSRSIRAHRRDALNLTTVQNGLKDSTRNMIRSYVSLFALFEATKSFNKTGQDFEALNSAMLAAMGSTEAAGEQIQFLDELTDRLGMSLIDTADQYTKFTFAAKGKLPTEEVNFLFQSMAEMGTVLGVSKERMKLSFTAIQQMMNKTTVTSEELKRQFAESMPGGIQLFANALKVSEKELFKLMESGQLISAEVLPKVALEMQKVANTAGALDAKYKTTRVQQGRFFKQLETARKVVFDNGMDEGLANMFSSLNDELKEGRDGLKGLGALYKAFFEVLGFGLKAISPILDSFLFVTGKVVGVFNKLSEVIGGPWMLVLGLLSARLLGVHKIFTGFSQTISKSKARFPVMAAGIGLIVKALKGLLGVGLLVVSVFDEIISMFTKGRVGLIERFLFGEDFDFSITDIFTKDIDVDLVIKKFSELGKKILESFKASNFFQNFADEFGNLDWSKLADGMWTAMKNLFKIFLEIPAKLVGNLQTLPLQILKGIMPSASISAPSSISPNLSKLPSSSLPNMQTVEFKPVINNEINASGLTPEQVGPIVEESTNKAIREAFNQEFNSALIQGN